jgi:hypothetical protein
MDDFIRSVCYFGWHRRLASLGAIIWGTFLLPQVGWSSTIDEEPSRIVEQILLKVDLGDTAGLQGQCDEVEASIQVSQDPVRKSRDFLMSFIAEVNARYGLSLTVLEASSLVRENLHLLPLSLEEKASLLMAVDLLEKGRSTITITLQEPCSESSPHLNANRWFGHLYWPWEWSWFGWNKGKDRDKENRESSNQSIAKNVDVELPGNCYFGACEAFAGALLCLIPHPAAWSAGVAMIIDGGRRVADGVIQLSDERRSDPNYKAPNPPF